VLSIWDGPAEPPNSPDTIKRIGCRTMTRPTRVLSSPTVVFGASSHTAKSALGTWIERLLGGFFALIVLTFTWMAAADLYRSYIPVEREPYLQLTTTHSVTLRWRTSEAEIGSVRYGDQRENLIATVRENAPTRQHRILIDDLEPGTTYYYEVVARSLEIDNTDRWFSTLRDESDTRPMYVWVIGDSGEPGPDQKSVAYQMDSWMSGRDAHIDLWILLGDVSYGRGSQTQFNTAFFGAYPQVLKHSAPWAVFGNHDAESLTFYDIFDSPTDGTSGGVASDDKHYYSIDDGEVHVLILDSETSEIHPGPMAQWIERDLEANTRQWTIACFHHAPYSDGTHNSDGSFWFSSKMRAMREHIVPILEKYDVDLVLSGHSHDYERSELIHDHYGMSDTFDPSRHIVQGGGRSYTKPATKGPGNGTVYMVMGSSSKVTERWVGVPLPLKHPAMPYSFPLLGSVVLEITNDSLRSSFITIDGDVKDTFVIHKEAPSAESTADDGNLPIVAGRREDGRGADDDDKS
jgi:predicted phosphodiesterase